MCPICVVAESIILDQNSDLDHARQLRFTSMKLQLSATSVHTWKCLLFTKDMSVTNGKISTAPYVL